MSHTFIKCAVGAQGEHDLDSCLKALEAMVGTTVPFPSPLQKRGNPVAEKSRRYVTNTTSNCTGFITVMCVWRVEVIIRSPCVFRDSSQPPYIISLRESQSHTDG